MTHHNEDVERALLGALLHNDRIYDDVAFLHPSYFYWESHGRIYAHIKAMKEQGKTVTPQYIAQYFANDNSLPENYIIDLADSCVSTTGAKTNAEQIYAMHLRRGLKKLARHLSDLSDNPVIDQAPQELLQAAEDFINEASKIDNSDTVRHIADKLDDAMDQFKTPPMGVKSGITQLDNLLRGYQPAKLYILGGRPAMGKTAMGLTHAINAATMGKKTLKFSLEMKHSEIQGRLIKRYGPDGTEIKDSWLWIDDKAGLTVADIAQRSRRHKRRHGLDIIFIDYLGLIRPIDKRAQMVHQIAEITGALKNLAKDLDVPVVLLCQLNRAVEKQDNKRPTLADLRDSGAIEQDADVVMFIYREEYYLANGPAQSSNYRKNSDADHLNALQNAKGKAEIIIAKNRHGRTGTVELKFDAERQWFHD